MNSRIKIVRIFSRLNIGGPSLHVTLLSQELGPDFETILVTGRPSPAEGDMSYLLDEAKDSFRHINIPELGRSIRFWQDGIAFFKILFLLIKEKPRIVHTHTSKAGVLGRLAAWVGRVPIRVHTFHGHVLEGYFSSIKTRLILYLETWLSSMSTKIIAISDKQKEDLVGKFKITSADKVTVIPLGLDLNKLLSQPTGTLSNVPKRSYSVGIVGRLVPIKNHIFFLDVAERILKNRNDVQFLIVGDGELYPLLKTQVVQRRIQNHVTFLGWQKNLKPLYERLDVLCLTSINEGTPVSIIEGQAFGTPVVVTQVGGIEDIVINGRNGFLVPLGDAEQFAQKIVFLLDRPDVRENMKTFAKSFIFSHFDKMRLIEDTRLLYRNLLNGGRR